MLRRVRRLRSIRECASCWVSFVVVTVGDGELGGRRDSCERHLRELVDESDVLRFASLEPAEARFVRRHVDRAEIRNPVVLLRETCERFLEPGPVASR